MIDTRRNYDMPSLGNFHVFEVNEFNELLDVRDNTKKPIMHYTVVDHIKCYFYTGYYGKEFIIRNYFSRLYFYSNS